MRPLAHILLSLLLIQKIQECIFRNRSGEIEALFKITAHPAEFFCHLLRFNAFCQDPEPLFLKVVDNVFQEIILTIEIGPDDGLVEGVKLSV